MWEELDILLIQYTSFQQNCSNICNNIVEQYCRNITQQYCSNRSLLLFCFHQCRLTLISILFILYFFLILRTRKNEQLVEPRLKLNYLW